MVATFPRSADTHESAPGDARVMHQINRQVGVSGSKNWVLVKGQEVRKGTLVVCEPRPLWVGQVTRVPEVGLISIRWWNTETFVEQATLEEAQDPYLRFLLPTQGVKPVRVAA